jgi:hypothetical protein
VLEVWMATIWVRLNFDDGMTVRTHVHLVTPRF